MDINITDISGHTFSICFNYDLLVMKCQILTHYETYYKTKFCNEKQITIHDFNRKTDYQNEWYKSDYYNTLNTTTYDLIHKNNILEFDKYTEYDFKDDNNINVVFINNYENNDDDNKQQ